MGLRQALAGLAGAAPVPVFAVEGPGAGAALDAVRLDPRVRLVDSPRAANVLLVVGGVPRRLLRPTVRVHDQMSHPRCTVWWPRGAPTRRLATRLPGILLVGPGDDAMSVVMDTHRTLLRGDRPSDPAVLPDVEPAPWRGVGPYRQGGKGMTGGVPFGRPMATRAPDRDRLELDFLPVRIGPCIPFFPPGLVLELRVQGDVIQEARIGEPAFVLSPDRDDPFRQALREPVLIVELERARARHHLRWAAGALRFHGLGALGERVLRLAVASELNVADARALIRLLERTRVLAWATSGVGVIPTERLAGTGLGPTARATGLVEDARTEDPAYRALGFAPVVTRGGDARARWRQRLEEVVQALELAERADRRRTEVTGVVESPHGRLAAGSAPTAALLERLPDLLAGQEWGDAMTTVVSLDLAPALPHTPAAP